MSETSVKLFLATKMKCAVVSALISIAFVSQAFALFAEETRSVHFHLFPRTRWLLSQYAASHSVDRDVSGPQLFDWARRTFHKPISTDYTETVQAIFRELELAVSER